MTSIFLAACRFAGNHRSYEGVRLLIGTLRGFQVTLSPRICRGTNGVNELRPAPTQVNAIDCKTLMLASRADTFHLTLELALCYSFDHVDEIPAKVATALRQLRQLQHFSFESPEQFEPWLEIFTDSETYGEIPTRELQQLSLEWCIDLNLPLMQRLVARFPTIEELNVTRARLFGAAELECLATSLLTKSLRKLVASRVAITSDSLRHLTAFENLQVLDLSGCGGVTDDGMAHVARVDTLQTLVIRSLYSMTDLSLKHLSALHDLRSLDCSHRITDEGMRSLLLPAAEGGVGGAGCKLLRNLTLSWCERITDDTLTFISEALRNSLESLCLRNCCVTVDGLLKLCEMRQLRELVIIECKQVSSAEAKSVLTAAMPHVEITL